MWLGLSRLLGFGIMFVVPIASCVLQNSQAMFIGPHGLVVADFLQVDILVPVHF
jgi:hypothetical protein